MKSKEKTDMMLWYSEIITPHTEQWMQYLLTWSFSWAKIAKVGWLWGINTDTHCNPTNTHWCKHTLKSSKQKANHRRNRCCLAVNLYHQPSSSSPLIGNEPVPKNVPKNWSSSTFQPITTPPWWFRWGNIGWYWLLGLLKVISDWSKDTDTYPTHITHTQATMPGWSES